ncbi:hypothetical protein MHBO_000858 [Bonamia ostreae]|uniref:Uncharacterized protein n=1 Tax=Bonamia ostreae TaxID=126728 RepID=A0ABV2AHR0_9EUKA
MGSKTLTLFVLKKRNVLIITFAVQCHKPIFNGRIDKVRTKCATTKCSAATYPNFYLMKNKSIFTNLSVTCQNNSLIEIAPYCEKPLFVYQTSNKTKDYYKKCRFGTFNGKRKMLNRCTFDADSGEAFSVNGKLVSSIDIKCGENGKSDFTLVKIYKTRFKLYRKIVRCQICQTDILTRNAGRSQLGNFVILVV